MAAGAGVEKKLVKSKSGYRMVVVDERVASPFTIDEPVWIPDYSCSNCQNVECRIKFDLLTRKHHCRRCGGCFCDSCSNSLVALPRMCFIDPVRHCRECSIISRKETEFFYKHLKTLMDGGKFHMHADSKMDNSSDISSIRPFDCVLSFDYRYLEFKGGTQGQENIAIQKISSVEITGSEQDNLVPGIVIQYMNAEGGTSRLEMDVDEMTGHRQQTVNWMTAMLKGFKLIDRSHISRASQ